MNMSEIISGVRGSFLLGDFVPAKWIIDEKKKIELESELSRDRKTNFNLVKYQELEQLSKKLNVNIDNICIVRNGMFDLYAYIDLNLGLYVSLYDLSEGVLESLQVKERIIEQEKYLRAMLEEKDYIGYFNMVESRLRLIMLNSKFKQIPDNYKYQIFSNVYSSMDYGFSNIDEIIYEKTKGLIPNSVKSIISDIADKSGMIDIYRGMGDKSTVIDDANSWTTDISTAAYFATRFKCKEPSIYKAKVHVDDVVAYIDHRNEKEIVVSGGVIDSYKMDLLVMNDILIDYPDVVNEFLAISGLINNDLFLISSDIHGVNHTKRVLLLSMIMSKIEGMSDIERDILIEAAMYHDIGRSNDEECLIHGIESYKLIEKNGSLIEYDIEEKEIIKYIIENHCISDESFLEIEKYEIKNRKRARHLLNIFKDMDALDRTRLGDLDASYFRTNAEKLILVAYQLLNYKL